MKLTKETLKRIIKEELRNVMYATNAQLGAFQDAADNAMAELDSKSLSRDGFEEAAIEAVQDQRGEDYVHFDFESYIEDGDGPEPSRVTLSVALGKNGDHEIEQSI
jgi:hypothetical protein